MLTRIFKSGNSLAVRIPKELGFDEAGREVEIERQGDAYTILHLPENLFLRTIAAHVPDMNCSRHRKYQNRFFGV